MKNIILFLIIPSFFYACTANETLAQESEKSYDIQHFLKRLDSAGLDISNDTLLFEIGYQSIYYGQNKRGNALIEYAFSKRDSLTEEEYHGWSVQNTKNGNYAIAVDKLEKAMKINPQETAAYYGWVLLYYYRDYEKALSILEQQDAYTPNFDDAPVGEDIHYLKGLCHMQLQHYQKAVDEFNIYINAMEITIGEDWVDVYTFVQKGRCLTKLGQFDEAIMSYNKAIKHYENCTEAYYFKGLTQIEMNKKEEACTNFNTALGLIKTGFKNEDVYIEYFHEIYTQQVEQSIIKYCK